MPIADAHAKRTLVLGCGNVLYGDDGFGPAVADALAEGFPIPEDAAVLNVGLATRGLVFDLLLADRHPERIVVIDAMRRPGRQPGEVFEVPLDELSAEKVDDFSFHQGPTSNLLRELRDFCGVEVVVVSCQPERIPPEMDRALSPPVGRAVGEAARLVWERWLRDGGAPEASRARREAGAGNGG